MVAAKGGGWGVGGMRRRWLRRRRSIWLALRLQAASAGLTTGHEGHSWIHTSSLVRRMTSYTEEVIYHLGHKSACLNSPAHSSRPRLFTLPPQLSIMWQLSDSTAADTLLIHWSESSWMETFSEKYLSKHRHLDTRSSFCTFYGLMVIIKSSSHCYIDHKIQEIVRCWLSNSSP